MKKRILCIILCLISLYTMNSQQQNNWKEVTELEKQGLPKSALVIVENIYQKAKKSNNTNQLIKSLLYKAKYALTLEENAQLSIITELKEEIASNTFPTKNIVENILANLYWQYFTENRWRFYNRTQTAQKVDPSDFRTWDLTALFAEIHMHYQQSLANGVLAQQTALKEFDPILSTATDSKKYRPTLFDFLAHNALAFYKTPENSIAKPAYAFRIDTPEYLKPHRDFIKLPIQTRDSVSLQFHALKLYQALLNFHKRDTDPTALIDVNIERLHYIAEQATFANATEVQLQTLLKEVQLHTKHQAVTAYQYEIAKLYQTQAANYIPNTHEADRWKLQKAVEICEQAIRTFPASSGAMACQRLKENILQPAIGSIEIENYIPIQHPSRILVHYTNVSNLHLRVVKISPAQLQSLRRMYQPAQKIALLNRLAVVTEWNQTLIDKKDYQQHATEISVPALAQGMYLMIASTSATLNSGTSFATGGFQVTDLALVETKAATHTRFQIVNRIDGAPVVNAKIKLSSQKKRNQLNTTLHTDAKGEATYSGSDYYYDVQATVSFGQDKAYFGGMYLNNNTHSNTSRPSKPRIKTFLFTDRSIYRPGQTVHFKGIMTHTQGTHHTEIMPNETISVALIDTNGQEVKKLSFTTNSFGSFAGTFILPASGLTGTYSLRTPNYNSTSFSVEAYKRPKFETAFSPITNTYKVNEQVQVTGTATAYAGSKITNAKVVYRVQRQVQYPRWCYWIPRLQQAPQEIIHGETRTDAQGAYTIEFTAIPDPSIVPTNQPIFRYEVTAEVTDINGETRSTSTIVNVGYHTLTASIAIPSTIDKTDTPPTLTVSTQNLNDQKIANTGSISIYKLIPPSVPLRKRPWKAPDYQSIDADTFQKLYPHDAYDGEDDPRNWQKGTEVLNTEYTTTSTGTKDIPLRNIKKWASGRYILQLDTKDRFGQSVQDIAYINLYDPKEKTIADQQLFEITTNQDSYSIGDTVLLTLSSASKAMSVTVDIEKDKKVIDTKVVQLSNTKKTIKIPVLESDLGGFSLSYSYVNHNGFGNGTIPISVPYPSTALTIETQTFRDKLQPGQPETWRFRIKGPKGDQIAAELLASMYDASLDQFRSHQWDFNPIHHPYYSAHSHRKAHQSFGSNSFTLHNQRQHTSHLPTQQYDQLNWFGLYFSQQPRRLMGMTMRKSAAPRAAMATTDMVEDEIQLEESIGAQALQTKGIADASSLDDTVTVSQEKTPKKQPITVRKNLQETAFFFPQLTTDASGSVSFEFTAPEALTQWKLQLLAHTPTLAAATQTLTTVTQKELMLTPNPPRFLREGDELVLSTKIANITSNALSGTITLALTDALTGKNIDTALQLATPQQDFSVAATGNTNVSWTVRIPDHIQAVQYKITARAGNFSDGEQNLLPVLSNRMLVTETLPMWIRSEQSKTFTLDKLQNNTSSSLRHHTLTLEMTSNPAWYAVQALPYLMEYPYECAEQTFARFYANALGSHITSVTPRIQTVFDQWKNTDALLSNLEKNQTLKSLIIQETPWLRDAQSETEQKKRIALLFDLNQMKSELHATLQKLEQMQLGSGAFPWFTGGRENRYITQHIVAGFGHLTKLGVSHSSEALLKKALRYLDQEFVDTYKELKAYCQKNNIDLQDDHLSHTQLHYLYMRSFFPSIPRKAATKEAWAYYQSQAKKYWIDRSLYEQGMLSLLLHRSDASNTAQQIIRSLAEKSITSDELGMYWKTNTPSWHWHQAPIETQALMIEAFSEIAPASQRTQWVDNLKVWLLKHKQTNRWQTTKATTDAVYALLLQGSDWLSITDQVAVTLGNTPIDPAVMADHAIEAGTGYFKTTWHTREITNDMASVQLTKKGKGIAWGALYWQYFEDLDKITSAKTPLQLQKQLFLKKYTDTGEQLTPITTSTPLALGDVVRVRIELRSDRAMEFVHMKDLRAAGLEPTDVLSQYHYQDGLGYYQSTKDTATHFFFDYLPKGVYVFEYDLRVNNQGDFSTGITTIQSMYAPEFSSHSNGGRIQIKPSK